MLNVPDVHLEEPFAKGIQWELTHIRADGTVLADGKPGLFSHSKMIMGPEKQVNVGKSLSCGPPQQVENDRPERTGRSRRPKTKLAV